MRSARFFFMPVLALLPAAHLSAQWTENELENVTLQEVSSQVVRLTWAAGASSSCGETTTYSVYRGTDENFAASEETQIASGLTVTHYIAHEPKGPTEFYYRVKEVRFLGPCPPPVLQSGVILADPLDLGREYTVTVADTTEKCKASSTSELTCITLPNFHAVIASQGLNEFLIGCLSSDYELNNWTCVNLKHGAYRIEVHSLSATVLDAGYSKINTKTGRDLGSVTPVFSVLAVLR